MNIQQAELVEMVGVRRETTGRFENGHYNPLIKLAMDIAKVFGKTVVEVFIFEESMEERWSSSSLMESQQELEFNYEQSLG